MSSPDDSKPEPTYNAANLIRGWRNRQGDQGPEGLAETGDPQIKGPAKDAAYMRAWRLKNLDPEPHAQAQNQGAGPDHVAELKRMDWYHTLSRYCDEVLEARMRGEETEHQSDDADAYRAEVLERRHPRGPRSDRGWRRIGGWWR